MLVWVLVKKWSLSLGLYIEDPLTILKTEDTNISEYNMHEQNQECKYAEEEIISMQPLQ